MAKKTSVMPPDDTAKRGFWNSRRSSIGWRLRHSHTHERTSTMAAPPNHSSDSTLTQPWLGASMMAYTSALRPTIDSSAPTGSSGVSVESFDFGTSTYPATRATAMIGRLTRNTEPHQKCSSSRPEASGPRAAPLPEMPAQMAIALARSRRGKTLVRIDSVDGMTNAAPTPITALATISIVGSSAKAPSTEPAANTTRPACRAPLRPKRSPRAAASEQQAGEHQAVGVDDPLHLGVGGAEAALLGRSLQRRQRHVEHGVADDDDDQRRAQDGERLPSPGVDVGIDAVEVVDRYGVSLFGSVHDSRPVRE